MNTATTNKDCLTITLFDTCLKYKLVVSISSPDLWDNDIDVKDWEIAAQTHFWRYGQYDVSLFFVFLLYYTVCQVFAAVKQTPVLVFHAAKSSC